MAILHHNHHRLEILDNDAFLATIGETAPKRLKQSKQQDRKVQVADNPPPQNLWKKEIVHRIRLKYAAMKDEEVTAMAARDVEELPRNIRKKKKKMEDEFWEHVDELMQWLEENGDIDLLEDL